MSDHLPRVERILPQGSWSRDETDSVILDYEERFRRRVVLTGQKTARFLLDLPHAQLLNHGEGLLLDNGDIIRVEAADEKLLEIRGSNPHHLLRLAWHLGNRHLPTQILEDRLIIRADHVIAHMVEGLGGHVTAIMGPFMPEGGAYGHGTVQEGAAHGHHHHGHSHEDDHPHLVKHHHHD